MLSIENMCNSITEYIGNQLEFDDDKKSIINYGIFAMIQMTICIVLIIIFGVIFNVLVEALIISFIGSILRKSSGGVHAKTPSKCAIIGTIACVLMGLIAKNLALNINYIISLGLVIFMWSYFIIYKLAPVDSPAKPIKSVKKKKRLKRNSLITISIYLIIIIFNIIYYLNYKEYKMIIYSFCIYEGLLWQVFSLTKIGHFVMGKLG